MSASACIVYYGLRYEIPPNAVGPLLEGESDPRIEAAHKAGLRCYWANFGAPRERYLLFIGAQLGILGPENCAEVTLPLPEFQGIVESTNKKLKLTALEGEARIYIQWEEDN